MKINNIIWDFDGTLFDSYPVMAEAFSAALAEYGITEPPDQIASLMKISAGHATRHYTGQHGLGNDFIERYSELSKHAQAEEVRPFDGVVQLCHDIKGAGGNNYLFTHRGESSFYFMEKFGLLPAFEELVTSDNNFARKPSPEAIIYLMGKYGMSSSDALMVGDRDIDILSAKNAGIGTCFVMDGNGPSDIAGYNINKFSELYDILGVGL